MDFCTGVLIEPRPEEQQASAVLFWARERLVHQRTDLVNALRAVLYEYPRGQLLWKNTVLIQMIDGEAVVVNVKKGRGADAIFAKYARIIRKLIPIRDTVEVGTGSPSHRMVELRA